MIDPAAECRVEDTIKAMLVERLFLKVQPSEIEDDAPLMEKLGVDSVAILEIVVGLEETYDLTFEDEEFDVEIFRTVRSISDYVRRKLAARGPPAEQGGERKEDR